MCSVYQIIDANDSTLIRSVKQLDSGLDSRQTILTY